MLRVPVPATRDPFPNTPLLRVPPGGGEPERFWISSWNRASGCTGVLTDAAGHARLYRFPPPHSGFYSAVAVDSDTLWLCGDLSRMVRLTLSDGTWQSFPTGADSGLVFQGMAYDPATGKLLAACFTGESTVAVSFDTRRGSTARVYRGISTAKYLRASFACDDGSFLLGLDTPEPRFVRWNPAAEQLEDAGRAADRLLQAWRIAGEADDLPDAFFAERTVRWFARRGDDVWGLRQRGGDGELVHADARTRATTELGPLADVNHLNLAVTADRSIVAVSRYGEFTRVDADTGAPQAHAVFPTDAVAEADCLVRLDARTMLGTPFISQRFWTVDLRTGEGVDQGRAAPGEGEILQTWHLDGLVYMAAYTGGELMRYDPAQPSTFPENPRVVATPQGAQRPVAAAERDGVIVYAATHGYGVLGGILTRYDTRTGEVRYLDDPLPGQTVETMVWPESRFMLAGTTRHADMRSAPPADDHGCLALLDAATLSVTEVVAMPAGTDTVRVHGRLDASAYLVSTTGASGVGWYRVDHRALAAVAPLPEIPGDIDPLRITAAPELGRFVVRRGDRAELWDLADARLLRVLHEEPGVYAQVVDGHNLYLLTPRELIVMDDVL